MAELLDDTHKLRWMGRSDLAACAELDFDSSQFPNTTKDLKVFLDDNHTIGMVVTVDEKVVGFMLYRRHKLSLELVYMVVDIRLRRHGIGKIMTTNLISRLDQPGRNRLIAYVRETQLEAQLFLRSQNLKCIKVLRSYFTDTHEDGYLFQFSRDNETRMLSEK